MADEYYESVRKQIKQATGRGAEPGDIFWTIVEGLAAVVDGMSGTSLASRANTGRQILFDTITSRGNTLGIATTPNPWFVLNGHDEGETVVTQNYLRNRNWKSVGGGVVALAGAVGSAATVVDVGGILQHGNATASTMAHLYKLQAIADSVKQSRTLSDWIGLLITVKGIKVIARGAALAGAAIPIPMAGMATGALAAVYKIGAKLTLTKVSLATAADIHWRAFQEQALSRSFGGGKGGKVGPASRMFFEIFQRRGLTRVFGQYDSNALIREPSGWMALFDKIMLI